MPIQILMPALSPTMTEGTLAKWLIEEGDKVSAGDLIAEIETDKATMEIEAVEEGTLARILVPEGTENVPVNQAIALMLEEGEDKQALEGFKAAAPPAATPPPAAPQAVAAAPAPVPPPAMVPAPAPPAAPSQANGQGGRIMVSPLAKRMAEQAGIALSGLAGSGPGGRIVKADIETALKSPAAAGVPALPAMPGPPAPGAEPTLIPHSGVRKIIAARLSEADRDVPQFYLTIDCRIDRLLAARKEINEAAPVDAETGKPAYRVSVNDMVIKAAAAALGRVPAVNAAWSDAAVIRYNTIDVAVAVAITDGLITPIIRHADRKGLAAISAEMKALAGRAKDGKLMPEEYQGGGFTVSNLGMFGIKDFTSIVNPPQACILAVAAGEPRAVVHDGAVAVRTVMSVTLTCDHRVVDGATGATWLQAFKGFIEAPARMLA